MSSLVEAHCVHDTWEFLPDRDTRYLGYSAFVHDVDKSYLGYPDFVYNGGAKWTTMNFSMMEAHGLISAFIMVPHTSSAVRVLHIFYCLTFLGHKCLTGSVSVCKDVNFWTYVKRTFIPRYVVSVRSVLHTFQGWNLVHRGLIAGHLSTLTLESIVQCRKNLFLQQKCY